MMPLDVDSLVPVEETPSPSPTDAKGQPQAPEAPKQPPVASPIDENSLTLDPPEKVMQDTNARIAAQGRPPFLSMVGGIIPRVAYDLGSVDYKMNPDKQKPDTVNAIAGATGLPQSEVDKYYEPLKMLLDVHNPAQLGADLGQRVSPTTTMGIVQATMTPAIVAAAAADPIGTGAGLVAFTALDHLIPTPQLQGATPDQQSSIDLIGMIAKGALVGGLFHSFDMTDTLHPDKLNMDNLLEKFTYEKLKDHGFPDVITLDTEQLQNLNQIDASNKRMRRNNARRQVIVDDLSAKLMNNEQMPNNVSPEIIMDAKQQVVDELQAKKETMTLKNREQQILFDLKKQLAEKPVLNSIIQDLGIDQKTADVALSNGNPVKIKAEKLVKVATSSPDNFAHVKEVLGVGGGSLEPIPGTGETKTAGLSLSVEAKAVENKLTKGFGGLPEYKSVKMDEQAGLAQDIVTKDYEQAKRIAMGEEKPPAGVIPEAVFVAVENRATVEGDASLLRDLATGSKLTTEATTMGQRIATLATRDPESPTGAIKDVLQSREESAQKRLGKQKLEEAKVEVAKEIKTAMKPKITKQNWGDFIKSLEC